MKQQTVSKMERVQTAVEWLAKALENYGDPQVCEINWKDLDSLVEQAKQMEKEQIITAASIGILWGEDEEQLQSSVRFGEEYYDRTFTLTPPNENPSATRTEQF